MTRPLPEPTLFLDECLGTTEVADALRTERIAVECLRDHFASGTEDAVWLPAVGKRGWVVLTKDKWIRRRDMERTALEDARVVAFVLTGGNLNGVEMAHAFLKAYPRMRKLLRDHDPPFIASVTPQGIVSILTGATRRGGKKKRR